MRFSNIKEYFVENLLLDKGNYRFRAASNQKQCIEKIYNQNPDNFKRLMENIGETDIAQPLIVYESEEGDNIVMDGNRRLAVLKVLYKPEEYSPASNLISKAHELKKLGKVDFNKILAMCSADKELINKTIYDIHAAGGGVSQIGWNAYANAIYRFHHGLEKGKKWQPTAILQSVENKYPEWMEFLTGEGFYETFSRIFNTALKKKLISEAVFSDKGLSVGTDKTLLDDAYDKSLKILNSIKNKEIGLSRKDGGSYADKKGIGLYLEKFSLSPDNQKIEAIISSSSDNTDSSVGRRDSAFTDRQSSPETVSDGGEVAQTVEPTTQKPESKGDAEMGVVAKSGYGINKSDKIWRKLDKLRSKKLINLYDSLCKVSLTQHPILLYVGAWNFFECLAKLLGANERTDFCSFYDGKLNNELNKYGKEKSKEFRRILIDIREKGTGNKHSNDWWTYSAQQLRIDFTTLESFIIDIIDLCIKK